MKIKYENYKGRRSDSIGDNGIFTDEESKFITKVEHFRTIENRNQTPTVTQIFRLVKEFLGITVLLIFLCLTAQADCITDGRDLNVIHLRWLRPCNFRDYASFANDWQKVDTGCIEREGKKESQFSKLQRDYYKIQVIATLNPWNWNDAVKEMGGFAMFLQRSRDVIKAIGKNQNKIIGIYQ